MYHSCASTSNCDNNIANSIMPEQEDPHGRKVRPSYYDNPALCQILEQLSELPCLKGSKNMRRSQPWPSQHQHAMSTNIYAHIITADQNENHSTNIPKYLSMRSSIQPDKLPNQVMSSFVASPVSPDPSSNGETNYLPRKKATTLKVSDFKLPKSPVSTGEIVGPRGPLRKVTAYHSHYKGWSSRHSSESRKSFSGTWPGSPCTVESSGLAAQPARQPKGPQDPTSDVGFDRSSSRPVTDPSKDSSSFLAEESLARQSHVQHPRQVDEQSPTNLNLEWKRPPARNSFAQPSSPRLLLPYRLSGHEVSDATNAYQNPYQRGFASLAMSRDPNQLNNQASAMISPKQMVPSKPFIPSTMALAAAGTAVRDPARMPQGSKYQGDAFSQSFLRQVPGLPDHFNCSLWLKGLPPTVQPYQLFDLIHCGSVWSLDLKPPTDMHATVAATLTFMTPYAALTFLNHCRLYGLQLGGHWISASYNKFGIPAIPSKESRVLVVEGPQHLMTPEEWEVQFKKACKFQMDRWLYLPCPILGRLRIEFRFVRVDGQAQSCRQMIERELGYLGITVWYGMDPCGQIGY